MHALSLASAFPVFRVPQFAPWKPKVFRAWLIQIGRRLAVLLPRSVSPVDFLAFCQYRLTKGQPPTGAGYVTGSHARLPADGVSAEVTWAGASTPVPSRDALPQGGAPAPVRFREIHFESSPFAVCKFTSSDRFQASGRVLFRMRTPERCSPPPETARSYSAGCRLLPWRTQLISRRLNIFHKAVRIADLFNGAVGKLCRKPCSMSIAVKRSIGSNLRMALMLSVNAPYPVACATKRFRRPLTAWSKCLFFSIRFWINSNSFSSRSISPASFLCRLSNSGWMDSFMAELLGFENHYVIRANARQGFFQ